MTELNLTAAIEAAADGMARLYGYPSANDPSWFDGGDRWRTRARAAVEAAAPLIEKAVREKVAREIDAYNATMQLGDDVFQDEGKSYLDKAAAIARGGDEASRG